VINLDEYVKRLEKALAFYADKKNYEDSRYWVIVNDEGKIARKALGRDEDE